MEVSSLVRAAVQGLLPYLDRPFALFGHSMGALVSFELARELRKGQGLVPYHLFVSARSAPQLPSQDPPIHNLSDQALVEELRRLNGTPLVLLEDWELLRLLLPIARADFALCETYNHNPNESPLDCPITAFGGLADRKVRLDALEAWRSQTSMFFSLQMFPGDHFFIHGARPLLLSAVSHGLSHGEGRYLGKENRERKA